MTGATGFIGAHLARRLLESGWAVRVLVRSVDGAKELVRAGATAFRGDLGDPASLAGVGDGVTHVFHAAAQLNLNVPGAKVSDFATNAGGTEALVAALGGAASTGGALEKFVHISSLAAIGIRPVGMIDEHFPCDPDLAYGKSKLQADLHLLRLHRERGLPVVLVRPPTVFGPGEKYNFLSMCRAIQTKRFVFIGDGSNRIDFLWIDNLTSALALAAERGRPGEVYLVADAPPLPFRTTVDTLWRILHGAPAPRWHLPVPLAYALAYPLGALGERLGRAVPLYPTRVRTMAGDMCFDLGKITRELGWASEGTFEEHARTAVAWYRAQKLL